LRNNKAPGMDLIPAELVKFAGPEYVKLLHQLIAKIWITETIPEESYLSIICPIHKMSWYVQTIEELACCA
jgi:hypothetical protein